MKDRSGLTVVTARNMMAPGFDSVNPPFAQHFLSRAGVAQWQSNGFVNRRSVVQPHSPAPYFQQLTAVAVGAETAGVITVLILAMARSRSSSLTLL